MITQIESKGFYIDQCRIPGETKVDERVPAQHNTIQLSRDRWFVIFETRGFRGVDDNLSVIYQVRKDKPFGPVLSEGRLDQSVNDWDPLGDGRKFVKQCNHSVAFGVPEGALINGKSVPHAGHFAATWTNHARALDPRSNYLSQSQEQPVPEGTSRRSWVQFRLNESRDDIEITQSKMPLRQVGYLKGDAFCRHTHLKGMNQSFVAPVAFDEDGSDWVHMMHCGTGTVIPVKYRWNRISKAFEWVDCGPELFGKDDLPIGEGAIAPDGDGWVIAARIGNKTFGNMWFRMADPFDFSPEPIFSEQVPSNCPRTLYRFPDGVIRVLTTDQKNSPYQDIYQRRIPLNILDINAESPGFDVIKTDVVFDSLKEGIPISKENAPTMHFCRLLPHTGGDTGYLTYFVRPRAITTQEFSGGVYKGLVKPGEIEASGVYYSEITYDRDYPAMWDFE